jgi:hypothetical protein
VHRATNLTLSAFTEQLLVRDINPSKNEIFVKYLDIAKAVLYIANTTKFIG